MSTKKLLLRPVAEKCFVSISSPLFADGSRSLESSSLDCSSVPSVHFRVVITSSTLETWQAIQFCGNHGSIRGSWPIAISGSPRGHSVQNSDSVPKHTGSNHQSDTPLEPSVSRTEPTTTQEDGTSSLPETLKLLADVILWRRSTLLSSKSSK
jgi:hypothetical protein